MTGKLIGRGETLRRALWTAFVVMTMTKVVTAQYPAARVVGSDGAGAATVCSEADEFCEFELPTPDADPRNIVGGPDGKLWFTELASGKIGRITTLGEIAEFETPSGAGALFGITAGPDGNIWFTEGNFVVQGHNYEIVTQKVGRITLLGAVTEFPADGVPGGIASGPDGNLWYTSNFLFPAVYRVTPEGSTELKAYPVPVTGGITTGPDGALWITEQGSSDGGGRIGRLTTSGLLTEYPVSLEFPSLIAVGADGSLWFTESDGTGAIGRISIHGTVTEFPLGADLVPTGIVAGRDGNVWFTMSRRGGGDPRIGRMTPDGSVTVFALPTSALWFAGIASGPDGNLWVTESSNRIGRFAPPPERERILAVPSRRRVRVLGSQASDE